MVVFAIVNATIELVAYRRLRRAPRLAPLITAVGMSFIVQNISLALYGVNFGPCRTSSRAPRRSGSVTSRYSWNKLVVLLITSRCSCC